MDDQLNNNGPMQYEPMQEMNDDSYATAILVLGILSTCFICLFSGIVSMICGIVSLALRAHHKDNISPEKQGLVTGGFVTSIIGVVLGSFVLVYVFVVVLLASGISSVVMQ